MATTGSIKHQFTVSNEVALRLKALLVAAACYSGLDTLLFLSWADVYSGAPVWVYQMLEFVIPPLFTLVMALILAQLSSGKAITNSLIVASIVAVLLLIGVTQESIQPGFHHWIHYLHTYSPMLLIVFVFPATAAIWQTRVNGRIKWPEQLAIIHVCLALILLTSIVVQYRWLVESREIERLTHARTLTARIQPIVCNKNCEPIKNLVSGWPQ